MSNNLINRGQERSVDTSYRALVRGPHPTYCAMPVLRGFLRVRSGCVWVSQYAALAFALFLEGAIRTLGGASS
jgi:hypothetical protein